MKRVKEFIGTFFIIFTILLSGCVENNSIDDWNNQIDIANDYAIKGTDYITQAENKINNGNYEESLSIFDSGIEQLNLSVSAGEKALEYSGNTGRDFLTEYTNEYIDNKKELKEYAENLKNYAIIMTLVENGKNIDPSFNATVSLISTAENTEEYSDAIQLFQRAKDNIPKVKEYIQNSVTYGTILGLDVYVEYIGKLSPLMDILEKLCNEGIEWAEAGINNDQEKMNTHMTVYGNLVDEFSQALDNLIEMQTQNPDLQREVGEDAFSILTNLRNQYKSAYEDHLNKAIEHKNKMKEIENAHPDEFKQKE